MLASRRRAALSRAVCGAAREPFLCEPLEQRRLLDGDPVIVLTEAFQPSLISTLRPYLWHNPSEYAWRLEDYATAPWTDHAGTDADGNNLPDDAYGWNFSDGGSPNIISTAPEHVHGTIVTGRCIQGIEQGADIDPDLDLPSHVKIMFVLNGDDTQTTDYIVDKINHGINIVAVSSSYGSGAPFTRAGADTLGNAGNGVLLFCASENSNLPQDSNLSMGSYDNPDAFDAATPRAGVPHPGVQNIIPVTTDPYLVSNPSAWGNYGINSVYFAAPDSDGVSYATSRSAAYAAVAAADYQAGHSGVSPTWDKIKRAMMSGVDYTKDIRPTDTLNTRTITHDYDGGRTSGGILNLGKIVTAINQAAPEVSDVSMTVHDGQDPLDPNVSFDLHGQGSISNWTINWGDNASSDVLPGSQALAFHPYPLSNVQHHYFPTIYAMSDPTSAMKQVYLPAPSDQAEVTVLGSDGLSPTSGEDDYTLAMDGNGKTLLTLTRPGGYNLSLSFDPGDLPSLMIDLGAGGDTFTLDLSLGNPLLTTSLAVMGVIGAGDVLQVIGSPGADAIVTTNIALLTIGATQFLTNLANLALVVDGEGGDDAITALAPACTVFGGDGDDTIHVTAIPGLNWGLNIDGGNGSDTITGGSGNDTILGGAGNDNVTGGAGDDILAGGAGNNTLLGGDGSDALYGGNDSDTLDGGLGADVVNGGIGTDTATYSSRTVALTISLDGQGNDGASGEADNVANVDVIIGGSGADTVSAVGITTSVTLLGQGGNDTITGGGSDDSIDGGDGNDLLNGGAGANTVHGGNGNDALIAEGDGDHLYGDAGNDSFYCQNYAADTVNGGSGTDVAYEWDPDLDEFVSVEFFAG